MSLKSCSTRKLPFTLHAGNCLDLMKHIPDGSINLVVTDPPFRCISGGQAHPETSNSKWDKLKPKGMLSKNNGKIFQHNDIDISDYLPELYRVMSQNSKLYIFTNNLNLEAFLRTAKMQGFKFHGLLVWHKNNCTPSRWYMKDMEPVLFFYKGKATPVNNRSAKAVKFCTNPRPKKHPTEKPVDLLCDYINEGSQPGQTVLDPFMGSGSTGVAAIASGRKFIGMEIDKEYFQIAKDRINEAWLESQHPKL